MLLNLTWIKGKLIGSLKNEPLPHNFPTHTYHPTPSSRTLGKKHAGARFIFKRMLERELEHVDLEDFFSLVRPKSDRLSGI